MSYIKSNYNIDLQNLYTGLNARKGRLQLFIAPMFVKLLDMHYYNTLDPCSQDV